MTAYPRSVSWIGISVGGMAFFLMFASWILVSYPIGSTVRGYFYGLESLEKVDLFISMGNQSTRDPSVGDKVDMVGKILASESDSQVLLSTNEAPVVSETKEMKDVEAPVPTSSMGSNAPMVENNTQVIDKNLSQVPLSSTSQPVILEDKEMKDLTAPVPKSSSALTKEENAKPSSDSSNATMNVEIKEPVSRSLNTSKDMGSNDTTASSFDPNSMDMGSNDSGSLNVLFSLWFFNSFVFSFKNLSLIIFLWFSFYGIYLLWNQISNYQDEVQLDIIICYMQDSYSPLILSNVRWLFKSQLD